MPVEPLEPGSIFTHGSTGDDWFTICAVEHLHGLGRDFVEEHMDVFSPNFRSTMAYALEIDPDEYMAARRRRFDHVRDLDLLLGDDTVLLTPTMCVEGFHPEGTGPDREQADAYNTGETNITGHPSLSVPAGRCPNGIPFGLQITGPRFRDDLVLNLGAAWESGQPLAARRTGLRTVLDLNRFRQDARSRRSNVTSATASATAAIATSTDRWRALKPFRSGSYSM